jgi:hypothetical protein
MVASVNNFHSTPTRTKGCVWLLIEFSLHQITVGREVELLFFSPLAVFQPFVLGQHLAECAFILIKTLAECNTFTARVAAWQRAQAAADPRKKECAGF